MIDADQFTMRIAALSDIGLVRNKNEDAFWFDTDRSIFILADGLGGHRAGEVAAALAVRIVAERLSLAVDSGLKDIRLIDAMQEAFLVASEEVYNSARESEKYSGMACSLIAGVYSHHHCYLAHVGDSRAYLFFQDTLSLMTVDDTPVAALIKRGYLLPEKGKSHQLKNLLIKTIGTKAEVDANISRFPVKPKERLLLCSDGLWSTVDNKTICETLLRLPEPEKVCRDLIDAARARGGADNITVIVADVPDHAEGDPADPKTAEIPKLRS